jgi:transcriptional regulator with XRE-family HTH domain
MNMKEVGERIKYLRQKHQMSQADLAKRIGTSQAVIWRWESGIGKYISDKNLDRLCSIFECSREYLLIGKDTPFDYPDRIREFLQNPDNRNDVIDAVMGIMEKRTRND